jgi:hypothetical protein
VDGDIVTGDVPICVPDELSHTIVRPTARLAAVGHSHAHASNAVSPDGHAHAAAVVAVKVEEAATVEVIPRQYEPPSGAPPFPRASVQFVPVQADVSVSNEDAFRLRICPGVGAPAIVYPPEVGSCGAVPASAGIAR